MKKAGGRFSAVVRVLAGVGVAMLSVVAAQAGGASASDAGSIIQSVTEVVDILGEYGLTADLQRNGRAITEALVKAGDPAARVLSAEEVAQLKARQDGAAYEAVVQIVCTNALPEVTEVPEGSAAATAGLKPGDLIEKIDGFELVSGIGAEELERRMRSYAAGKVELMVRQREEASRTVHLDREPVRLPAIEIAEDLPANHCYLKINGIYEGSAKEIISTLRGWSEAHRFGVVIDLRGSSGRDLQSAAEVAGLFGESGALLFTVRDPQDQDVKVFKAQGGTPLGMPAMVLIDTNTAGASEVLAAALNISVRGAMLIGAATRGDPAVREAVALPSGDFAYMVTQRIVLPDGKVLAGREGIAPDVAVSEIISESALFEPEPSPTAKELSDDEKEARDLRVRIRNDFALRRAVDILQGLKALNVRGIGIPETPTD